LQHLDSSLSNRLKIWDEGRGFSAIRDAWQQRALGLGGQVSADAVTGIFEGLAPDGALILRRDHGVRQLIHSGEVRFAELERQRQP
jgi:BirA family biotin operon repressor/biotin-[acetyl-CoA-carboxylase] ligase